MCKKFSVKNWMDFEYDKFVELNPKFENKETISNFGFWHSFIIELQMFLSIAFHTCINNSCLPDITR